ncbi:MAG TPA: dTDP-4-dehydrorhamnose reductase [Bradyrhizobium sp.]|nr:dTDP-4-dehydrorhamnose reductase [Bradyrhizobium sp.]
MKVLVLGREGQLARGLVEAALGTGIQIVSIGRPEIDLTDKASVGAVFAREHPDIVVNAAAYTAVDKAESEPAVAHAVNALGAEYAARACAAQSIPIVHISTDYVFDGIKDSPYLESDRTGPINVYGSTKLEGEQRVAKVCERHVILRTAWVYSPWGTNFVKTMLRLATTRPSINVVQDQLGSPTYAPDLARTILSLATLVVDDDDSRGWGTYHVVCSGETSWSGLAREIFRHAAQNGLPVADVAGIAATAYPTPARRPGNSRLNCDKLRLLFGLELPDWRLGVKDCVARLAASSQAGA